MVNKVRIIGILALGVIGFVFLILSNEVTPTFTEQDFKDELEKQGVDVNEDTIETTQNIGFIDISDDLIVEIDEEQLPDQELPEFNDGTNPTIIDEIADIIIPPESLTAEITRTITFENGEIDTRLLSSFDLSEKTLDFLAEKGTKKSFINSKINFDIEVELGDSIIKVAQLKVLTLVNDKVIKEKTFTIDTQSIMIENSLATISLDEILPDSLAPQITEGQVQHTKISKIITSLFFITEDGKSFFLEQPIDIYEITLTRDGRLSIITNENGKSVKIFDTDIQFQIAQAFWTYSKQRCVRLPPWGGNCILWGTQTYKMIPNAVGPVKLIDAMSGETILTSEGKTKGSCGFGGCHNGRFYGTGETGRTSNIVIETLLQRNHSYVVIVSDPTPANWKIDVPKSGNPVFSYVCAEKCKFPGVK